MVRLMKQTRKKLKKTNIGYFILCFLIFIIIIYLTIYFLYIHPLSKLHNIQTKEWIVDFTNKIVLGIKNHDYLYKIQNTKINNVSFYYNYFFFHTKKYTLFTLFNIKNKFSNEITLNVYLYDFENKTTDLNQLTLNLNELKTSKINNNLIITCGDAYIQKINMIENTMKIIVNTPNIKYNFELDINDYNTNQPTFIPRYYNLRSLVKFYNPITSSPGEWCSDNPMIGSIKRGMINNDEIVNEGNFWFDNYIGTNDHFLTSYIWFVVLNDDWLIYLLWFGEYEKDNKTMCFLIKDKKTNKEYFSGFGHSIIPFPFNALSNIINPIDSKYIINNKIGDKVFDDYEVYFKSNEISIHFNSIKGESHQVFLYDYYNSAHDDKLNPESNKFDSQYKKIIQNYEYTEYVNLINVEININGKTEKFVARNVIDAMFKKDKKIPNTI